MNTEDEEDRRILDQVEHIQIGVDVPSAWLLLVSACARRMEARLAEREARIEAAREHIGEAFVYSSRPDQCLAHIIAARDILDGKVDR